MITIVNAIKAAFHIFATTTAVAGKNVQQSCVAIMWKPLFSDRNDHSNHMETSLYGNCSAINDYLSFLVVIVAIISMEIILQSTVKCDRPGEGCPVKEYNFRHDID